MARRWTDDEKARAIALSGQMPISQVAAELNRPLPATYKMLHLLGANKYKRWTEDEDMVLRDEAARGRTSAQIAAIIGCRVKKVTYRAKFLGVLVRKDGSWLTSEENLLKELLAKGCDMWTIRGQVPRRTEGQIRYHISKLGIRRSDTPDQPTAWADAEEAFLVANYGTWKNKDLAAVLQKPVSSMRSKAMELGLVKSVRLGGWPRGHTHTIESRLQMSESRTGKSPPAEQIQRTVETRMRNRKRLAIKNLKSFLGKAEVLNG
jgi:transposase-like protein